MIDDEKDITMAEEAAGTYNPAAHTKKTADFEEHYFKTYRKIRPVTTCGEADISIVSKDGAEFVLKHYLKKAPDSELLKRIKDISDKYPDNLIKIYEYGVDDSQERKTYEIQHYAALGSLKDYMKTEVPDENTLKLIINQVAESLKIIHENNVLHCDLKPANILVLNDKPLKLVLTDFGVASIIEEDLSKKETKYYKGTCFYRSPESYTRIISEKTDYWSLGMVILEILGHGNVFDGISDALFTYSITTKGISIPHNVPDYIMPLLKGLLTRDPAKRWGHEEIKGWLSGKQDLISYYDEEIESLKIYKKPFPFMNNLYYSLETLVSSFIESPEAWEESKKSVFEDEITFWFGSNDDLILGKNYVNVKKSSSDQDTVIFRLVYNFNKKLPFALMGKEITLHNIYNFIRGYNTGGTPQKIVDMMVEGKIDEYFNEYRSLTLLDTSVLKGIFDFIHKILEPFKEKAHKIEFLKKILTPYCEDEDMILPDEIKSDPLAKLKFIFEFGNLLISEIKFKKIIKEHILPDSLISLMRKKKAIYPAIASFIITEEHIKRSEVESSILPEELKNNLISSDHKTFITAFRYYKYLKSIGNIIKCKDKHYDSEKYTISLYSGPSGFGSEKERETFLEQINVNVEKSSLKALVNINKNINAYTVGSPFKTDILYIKSGDKYIIENENRDFSNIFIETGGTLIIKKSNISLHSEGFIFCHGIMQVDNSNLLPSIDTDTWGGIIFYGSNTAQSFISNSQIFSSNGIRNLLNHGNNPMILSSTASILFIKCNSGNISVHKNIFDSCFPDRNQLITSYLSNLKVIKCEARLDKNLHKIEMRIIDKNNQPAYWNRVVEIAAAPETFLKS